MKRTTAAASVLGVILATGLAAASPLQAAGKGHGGCHGDRHARHHHMRHGDADAHLERMAERLDLTAAQLAQMRAVTDASRAERRALTDRLRETRRELRELVRSGAAGEAEIRPLAEAQAAAMADLIVLRTTTRAQIHALLSEEQRQQLEERRGRHRRHG